MSEFEDGAPKYPYLKLLVRRGDVASIGMAVMALLITLALTFETGSVVVCVIGVALAALAYVLTKILVELVRLITDMLLPQ